MSGLLSGAVSRRQHAWRAEPSSRQVAPAPVVEADELLLSAAEQGDLPGARQALRLGASLSSVDPDWGHSALMLAAKHGRLAVVDFLLEEMARQHGRGRGGAASSINARSLPLAHDGHVGKGLTALWLAAAQNHVGVTRALLRSRASVDLRTGGGDTPLRVAASAGHAEVVRVLCQGGADPRVEVAGETAIGWARKLQHQEVVGLLERAGELRAEEMGLEAEMSSLLGHEQQPASGSEEIMPGQPPAAVEESEEELLSRIEREGNALSSIAGTKTLIARRRKGDDAFEQWFGDGELASDDDETASKQQDDGSIRPPELVQSDADDDDKPVGRPKLEAGTGLVGGVLARRSSFVRRKRAPLVRQQSNAIKQARLLSRQASQSIVQEPSEVRKVAGMMIFVALLASVVLLSPNVTTLGLVWAAMACFFVMLSRRRRRWKRNRAAGDAPAVLFICLYAMAMFLLPTSLMVGFGRADNASGILGWVGSNIFIFLLWMTGWLFLFMKHHAGELARVDDSLDLYEDEAGNVIVNKDHMMLHMPRGAVFLLKTLSVAYEGYAYIGFSFFPALPWQDVPKPNGFPDPSRVLMFGQLEFGSLVKHYVLFICACAFVPLAFLGLFMADKYGDRGHFLLVVDLCFDTFSFPVIKQFVAIFSCTDSDISQRKDGIVTRSCADSVESGPCMDIAPQIPCWDTTHFVHIVLVMVLLVPYYLIGLWLRTESQARSSAIVIDGCFDIVAFQMKSMLAVIASGYGDCFPVIVISAVEVAVLIMLVMAWRHKFSNVVSLNAVRVIGLVAACANGFYTVYVTAKYSDADFPVCAKHEVYNISKVYNPAVSYGDFWGLIMVNLAVFVLGIATYKHQKRQLAAAHNACNLDALGGQDQDALVDAFADSDKVTEVDYAIITSRLERRKTLQADLKKRGLLVRTAREMPFVLWASELENEEGGARQQIEDVTLDVALLSKGKKHSQQSEEDRMRVVLRGVDSRSEGGHRVIKMLRGVLASDSPSQSCLDHFKSCLETISCGQVAAKTRLKHDLCLHFEDVMPDTHDASDTDIFAKGGDFEKIRRLDEIVKVHNITELHINDCPVTFNALAVEQIDGKNPRSIEDTDETRRWRKHMTIDRMVCKLALGNTYSVTAIMHDFKRYYPVLTKPKHEFQEAYGNMKCTIPSTTPSVANESTIAEISDKLCIQLGALLRLHEQIQDRIDEQFELAENSEEYIRRMFSGLDAVFVERLLYLHQSVSKSAALNLSRLKDEGVNVTNAVGLSEDQSQKLQEHLFRLYGINLTNEDLGRGDAAVLAGWLATAEGSGTASESPMPRKYALRKTKSKSSNIINTDLSLPLLWLRELKLSNNPELVGEGLILSTDWCQDIQPPVDDDLYLSDRLHGGELSEINFATALNSDDATRWRLAHMQQHTARRRAARNQTMDTSISNRSEVDVNPFLELSKWQHLCTALTSLPNLRELGLANVGMGPKAAKIFAAAAKQMANLTVIDVLSNKLGSNGVTEINELFQENVHIQSMCGIKVADILPIDDTTAAWLGRERRRNCGNLHGRNLGVEDYLLISFEVGQERALSRINQLDISSNGKFEADSAIAMSNAIASSTNTGLSSLIVDLGSNRRVLLNINGGSVVEQPLIPETDINSNVLYQLDLSSISILPVDMMLLTGWILHGSQVEHLLLNDNPNLLDDHGIVTGSLGNKVDTWDRFCSSLASCCVKHIELRNIGLEPKTCAMLASTFSPTTSMRTVDISHNWIGVAGRAAWAEAIAIARLQRFVFDLQSDGEAHVMTLDASQDSLQLQTSNLYSQDMELVASWVQASTSRVVQVDLSGNPVFKRKQEGVPSGKTTTVPNIDQASVSVIDKVKVSMQLSVTIIECRGLPTGGAPDAMDVFVALDIGAKGKARIPTSTITYGGSSPIWGAGNGETFTNIYQPTDKRPKQIAIEVYTEDVGHNHLIGRLLIPLQGQLSKPEWSHAGWYGLSNADGHSAGEVHLAMRWAPVQPESAAPIWHLSVTVMECDDLPKRDLISANDVYVRCSTALGKLLKTSTIQFGGANPVWSPAETLVFELTERPLTVAITAMDEDFATEDDLIGVHVLDIGMSNCDSFFLEDTWLDFTDDKAHEAGCVRCSVKCIKQEPVYNLTATVLECSDLRKRHLISNNMTYIRASVEHRSRTTSSAIQQDDTIRWPNGGEEMLWIMDHAPEKVMIQIWNDQQLVADQLIGSCSATIPISIRSQRASKRHRSGTLSQQDDSWQNGDWLELVDSDGAPCGKILIRLELIKVRPEVPLDVSAAQKASETASSIITELSKDKDIGAEASRKFAMGWVRDSVGWKAFCNRLSGSQIRVINVAGIQMSASATHVLAVSLPSTIEAIDISRNSIMPLGKTALAQAVRDHSGVLQSLVVDLGGRNTMVTLRFNADVLDFQNMDLNPDDVPILAAWLSFCMPNFIALSHNMNVFKSEDVKIAVKAMSLFFEDSVGLNSVQNLQLASIDMSDSAWPFILPALSRMSCLVELNLSGNPLIGSVDVASMDSKAAWQEQWLRFCKLMHNIPLGRLNLGNINLKIEQAIALMEEISTRADTSPLALSLEDNLQLYGEIHHALLLMLPKAARVAQKIGTPLRHRNWKRLCNLFGRSKLSELHICNIGFGEDAAMQLAAMLADSSAMINQSLSKLTLDTSTSRNKYTLDISQDAIDMAGIHVNSADVHVIAAWLTKPQVMQKVRIIAINSTGIFSEPISYRLLCPRDDRPPTPEEETVDLRDCNTSQADVLLLANWLHIPAVKTAVKAIYFETTGDKKDIKFKRRSSIALTFFQSSLKISNRRLGCHDAQVLAAWLEIHQTSVNTLDISGNDMLDLQGATALSRAIKAQRVLYRPITLYSEKKSNRKFKSLLAGTLQSHRAQLILSLGESMPIDGEIACAVRTTRPSIISATLEKARTQSVSGCEGWVQQDRLDESKVFTCQKSVYLSLTKDQPKKIRDGMDAQGEDVFRMLHKGESFLALDEHILPVSQQHVQMGIQRGRLVQTHCGWAKLELCEAAHLETIILGCLAREIPLNSCDTQLDLSASQLGPTDAVILAAAIPTNPHLVSVNLLRNPLGDGVHAVIDMLAKTSVQTLCGIQDGHFDEGQNWVEGETVWNKPDLGMGPADMQLLAADIKLEGATAEGKKIGRRTRLRAIVLHGNPITGSLLTKQVYESEATKWREQFSLGCKLSRVADQSTPTWMANSEDYLATWAALSQAQIEQEDVNIDGLRSLLVAISVSNVTHLDISACCLGSHAMTILSLGLPSTIRELKIAHNPVGMIGAYKIVTALDSAIKKALKQGSMELEGITIANLPRLNGKWRKPTRIKMFSTDTKLNFEGEDLDPADTAILSVAMISYSSLETVNVLGDHRLGEQGTSGILQIFDGRPGLKTLLGLQPNLDYINISNKNADSQCARVLAAELVAGRTTTSVTDLDISCNPIVLETLRKGCRVMLIKTPEITGTVASDPRQFVTDLGETISQVQIEMDDGTFWTVADKHQDMASTDWIDRQDISVLPFENEWVTLCKAMMPSTGMLVDMLLTAWGPETLETTVAIFGLGNDASKDIGTPSKSSSPKSSVSPSADKNTMPLEKRVGIALAEDSGTHVFDLELLLDEIAAASAAGDNTSGMESQLLRRYLAIIGAEVHAELEKQFQLHGGDVISVKANRGSKSSWALVRFKNTLIAREAIANCQTKNPDWRMHVVDMDEHNVEIAWMNRLRNEVESLLVSDIKSMLVDVGVHEAEIERRLSDLDRKQAVIKRLNLSDIGLGPLALTRFAENLGVSQEYINLSYNSLIGLSADEQGREDTFGWDVFCTALEPSAVTELNVSHCNLNSSAIYRLAKSIPLMKKLHLLTLDSTGVRHGAVTFTLNANQSTLDLNGLSLGTADLTLLAAWEAKPEVQTKSLVLDGNWLVEDERVDDESHLNHSDEALEEVLDRPKSFADSRRHASDAMSGIQRQLLTDIQHSNVAQERHNQLQEFFSKRGVVDVDALLEPNSVEEAAEGPGSPLAAGTDHSFNNSSGSVLHGQHHTPMSAQKHSFNNKPMYVPMDSSEHKVCLAMETWASRLNMSVGHPGAEAVNTVQHESELQPEPEVAQPQSEFKVAAAESELEPEFEAAAAESKLEPEFEVAAAESELESELEPEQESRINRQRIATLSTLRKAAMASRMVTETRAPGLEISMKGCGLLAESICAFVGALAQPLQTLDISHNRIGTEGQMHLAQTLKGFDGRIEHKPSLAVLVTDLAHDASLQKENEFGGVITLRAAATVLRVPRCGMLPESAVLLAAWMQMSAPHRHLQRLELCHNSSSMGVQGALAIANVIHGSNLNELVVHQSLRIPVHAIGQLGLDLREQGMGPPDTVLLAAALSTNKGIEHLVLTDNPELTGAPNLESVGTAVADGHSSADDVRLGWSLLCAVLSGHMIGVPAKWIPSLSSLWGAAVAAHECRTLVSLDLCGCGIDPQGLALLAHSVGDNRLPRLEELHLARNHALTGIRRKDLSFHGQAELELQYGQDLTGWEALCEALGGGSLARKLVVLDVSDCCLTQKAMGMLALVLPRMVALGLRRDGTQVDGCLNLSKNKMGFESPEDDDLKSAAAAGLAQMGGLRGLAKKKIRDPQAIPPGVAAFASVLPSWGKVGKAAELRIGMIKTEKALRVPLHDPSAVVLSFAFPSVQVRDKDHISRTVPRIGRVDGLLLVSALGTNHNLEELSLGGVQLGPYGKAALAHSLRTMFKLKKLSVDVGDAGGTTAKLDVQDYAIDLRRCSLQGADLLVLADWLLHAERPDQNDARHMCSILRLSENESLLERHDFEPAVAEWAELCQALRQTRITELEICHVGLDATQAPNIAKSLEMAMRNMSVLERVDLSRNPVCVQDEALHLIVGVREMKPHLQIEHEP